MSYSKELKSRLLYNVTSADEVNDFTRKNGTYGSRYRERRVPF